jgi:hypothetical protein
MTSLRGEISILPMCCTGVASVRQLSDQRVSSFCQVLVKNWISSLATAVAWVMMPRWLASGISA